MKALKDIFPSDGHFNPGSVVTPDSPRSLIKFAQNLYRKITGSLMITSASLRETGLSDSGHMPKWRERVMDPFSFSLFSLSSRPFHRELGRMFLPIEDARLQPGVIPTVFRQRAFSALDQFPNTTIAVGSLIDPISYGEKDALFIGFPDHAEFWTDEAESFVSDDDSATDRAVFALFRPYLLPSLTLVKDWAQTSPIALKGGYREF